MRKQKITSIVILWIFLITLTWCTKKIWNTTTDEIIHDWEDLTIIDTTTSEEKIWNESIEETNSEITSQENNTNLEEYYQESIKKIDEISEWFKEIKTSDIEINWLKGKNTIYETIQNNTNIKSQQTVFIKDNIVYVLQYTATKETFDKYINDVNNIIKSFTLKN